MTDKLKPCPFCGGEAKITQLDLQSENILNKKWVIGCDGILFGPICPGYIYKCAPFYICKESAIRAWNNRDGNSEKHAEPGEQ